MVKKDNLSTVIACLSSCFSANAPRFLFKWKIWAWIPLENRVFEIDTVAAGLIDSGQIWCRLIRPVPASISAWPFKNGEGRRKEDGGDCIHAILLLFVYGTFYSKIGLLFLLTLLLVDHVYTYIYWSVLKDGRHMFTSRRSRSDDASMKRNACFYLPTNYEVDRKYP